MSYRVGAFGFYYIKMTVEVGNCANYCLVECLSLLY